MNHRKCQIFLQEIYSLGLIDFVGVTIKTDGKFVPLSFFHVNDTFIILSTGNMFKFSLDPDANLCLIPLYQPLEGILSCKALDPKLRRKIIFNLDLFYTA